MKNKIWLLFLLNFFIIVSTAQADEQDIILNEVLYDASGSDTGQEFIEIFNRGSEPVNLAGWNLDPSSAPYFTLPEIIINSDNYLVIHINAEGINDDHHIYTGLIGNMSNAAGPISLFNSSSHSTENLIAYLAYGTSEQTNETKAIEKGIWETNDFIIKSEAGQSLAYDGSGHSSADWFSGNPTPGTANSVYAAPPPAETPTQPDTPIEAPPPINKNSRSFKPKAGDILINEFVADPNDDEEEWIELYNTTDQDINLTGWQITEGSEKNTLLTGTISAKDFFLIEKPAGKLNNLGDIIILTNSNGLLIDQVTYGNWDDGSIENNAPKAEDPTSTARRSDGLNTSNNAADFTKTTTPSKNKSNLISANNLPADTSPNHLNNQIILNEIYPNPLGNDAPDEFIELKNISEQTLDITGWSLSDNSHTYVINPTDLTQQTLNAGEIIAFHRSLTNLALNNFGGDRVTLKNAKGEIISEIKYSATAIEGQSYIFTTTGWQWTNEPTPNKTNILKKDNQPPIALFETEEIILLTDALELDASDSFDPNQDDLNFLWDFGDGHGLAGIITTYHYWQVGEYKITLTVSDGQLETKISKQIKIVSEKNDLPLSKEEFNDTHNVAISEFLPNPPGEDSDGEWIEIKNLTNQKINLAGWTIDDIDGGSRPYVIPKNTLLDAYGWLIFDRDDTKIALNNTADEVRLISTEGKVIDRIPYQGVRENMSYAKISTGWLWTETTTPGEENIATNSLIPAEYTPGSIEIEPSDLHRLANNTIIKTRGIVTVPPLYFAKTYFYITGLTPGQDNLVSGVKIYMAKADWPELKIGMVVEIAGTFNNTGSEPYLKIANQTDIKILTTADVLMPSIARVNQITDSILGSLITIEGQIIEIKGQNIYLDDGSGELRIYLNQNTNTNKSDFKTGDFIQASGLLSKTSSGFRLLPRNNDDLKKTEVLGATINKTKDPKQKITQQNLANYLVTIIIVLIILLIELTRQIKLKSLKKKNSTD